MSISQAINLGLENARQFFEGLAAAHRPAAAAPGFDDGWDTAVSGAEPRPAFDRAMLGPGPGPGRPVRSGINEPQQFEPVAEGAFNLLTGWLRHLPIRI